MKFYCENCHSEIEYDEVIECECGKNYCVNCECCEEPEND